MSAVTEVTGEFLSDVKQSRAYVNKTIIESQLSMGNRAILFDGLSEVRESYREAAEMTDIPAFIRQHPDTPFSFCIAQCTAGKHLTGPKRCENHAQKAFMVSGTFSSSFLSLVRFLISNMGATPFRFCIALPT
jgi:hypothetical protein